MIQKGIFCTPVNGEIEEIKYNPDLGDYLFVWDQAKIRLLNLQEQNFNNNATLRRITTGQQFQRFGKDFLRLLFGNLILCRSTMPQETKTFLLKEYPGYSGYYGGGELLLPSPRLCSVRKFRWDKKDSKPWSQLGQIPLLCATTCVVVFLSLLLALAG